MGPRAVSPGMRMVLLTVGVAVCAGCTASPASRAAVSASPAAERALASPACSTAAAPSRDLTSARTAMLTTNGNPFGVAVTPDGHYGFASVDGPLLSNFTSDELETIDTATLP